jgi:hypothetical protein
LAAGLAIVFGSFSYITERALTHSTDAALQEKLSEATAVAASVDALIGQVSQQFSGLARLMGTKEEL